MIRLLDVAPLPEEDLMEKAVSDDTIVVIMVILLLLATLAILFLAIRRKQLKRNL